MQARFLTTGVRPSWEDVIEAMRGRSLAGTLHATGHMERPFCRSCEMRGSRGWQRRWPRPTSVHLGSRGDAHLGTSPKDDEVGPMIYREFAPQALAARRSSPPRRRSWARALKCSRLPLGSPEGGVSAAKNRRYPALSDQPGGFSRSQSEVARTFADWEVSTGKTRLGRACAPAGACVPETCSRPLFPETTYRT